MTVGTPACTGTCTIVSGSVTIPSGITCPTNHSLAICPGAPLYLGLLLVPPGSDGPTAIYATQISSPSVGANGFTLTVPSGPNYFVFGILDQLNNGGFTAGSVSNTQNNVVGNLTIPSGGSYTIPGTTTLPSTNSIAAVSTNYSTYTCQGCGSTSSSYQLNFYVEESNKLPVAVTLNSGPNLINTAGTVAIDMSNGGCNNCGSSPFEYSALLPGGAPKINDKYGFTVTYSDGTQDSGTTVNGVVTAFGSTGAVVGPSDLPTLNSPANGTTAATDQPAFSWNDPTLTNPGNYYYRFDLSAQDCNGNCTIWQIPGNNSKSGGFTYTTTSLTWGVDPISGDNSTPSVTQLTSTDVYNWSIQVSDGSNNSSTQPNSAQSSVWFVAP